MKDSWERIIKKRMEAVSDEGLVYRPKRGEKLSIILPAQGLSLERMLSNPEATPSGFADEILLDISDEEFLVASVTRESRGDAQQRSNTYTHCIPWEKIVDMIFEDLWTTRQND
jgi:hypothetical protein